MFVENKYHKWYFNIIDKAKTRNTNGYTELHHIIPKSMGGVNDKSNLVKLTAREHFICHLLLVKFVTGTFKRNMAFALNAMSTLSNKHQDRYIPTSKLYAISRKLYSEEQSKFMAESGNPMYGKTHTEDARLKMSKFHKGRIPANKGKHHTEDTKIKISKATSGSNNPMYGRTHTEETKLKQSKAKLDKRNVKLQGKPKSESHRKKLSEANAGKLFTEERKLKLKQIPKISCVYCWKLSSPAMHKRWHGEQCKHKI
jgi:hypothetical protein